MKFINFSIFVGHFCPPGSGSNPDRDPQHWLNLLLCSQGLNKHNFPGALFTVKVAGSLNIFNLGGRASGGVLQASPPLP
jgi:hypothetical protein